METSTTTTTVADSLAEHIATAMNTATLVADLGVTTGHTPTFALHGLSRADFDALVGATGATQMHFPSEEVGHEFWTARASLVGVPVDFYTNEAPAEVTA